MKTRVFVEKRAPSPAQPWANCSLNFILVSRTSLGNENPYTFSAIQIYFHWLSLLPTWASLTRPLTQISGVVRLEGACPLGQLKCKVTVRFDARRSANTLSDIWTRRTSRISGSPAVLRRGRERTSARRVHKRTNCHVSEHSLYIDARWNAAVNEGSIASLILMRDAVIWNNHNGCLNGIGKNYDILRKNDPKQELAIRVSPSGLSCISACQFWNCLNSRTFGKHWRQNFLTQATDYGACLL